MTETIVDQAKSDAMRWQADARNRPGDPAPAPDEVNRERVWALGCPGASVAAAVLGGTAGWCPVPLGDDQHPSSEPLGSYGAVYEHYRNRHRDGTGIALGAQPGAVLVAVRGTAQAWNAWCAAYAVESSAPRFEDGSGPAMRSYKDLGHFVSVSWQPPATGFRTSGVAVGRAALDKAAESMRPRHTGSGDRGWLLWAIPAGDRPLTFPASRKLGHGLDVLGEGVVPLFARRGDGWTVLLSSLPVVEEMPTWLGAELGGRGGKRRP